MTKITRPTFAAFLAIVTCAMSLAPASATESTAAVDQVAERCGNPRPFGDLCCFYGSGYGGALAGFVSDIPDLLSPIRWLYPEPGAGESVANNARDVDNRDLSCAVTIYSNPGYAGDSITLPPGTPTAFLGGFRNRGHYFHSCR